MREWVMKLDAAAAANVEAVRVDVPEYDWPLPNVWLGVSAEDQATADERIPILLDTPAAVRFVSYEPALGPVDFTSIRNAGMIFSNRGQVSLEPVNVLTGKTGSMEIPSLDWVIAGGESGPNARPSNPEWFRLLRDQCAAAGVPYFFKQWGEWAPYNQIGGCGVSRDDRTADRWMIHAAGGGWLFDERGFEVRILDESTEVRVGKKAAGALLDGFEWREFPSVVV